MKNDNDGDNIFERIFKCLFSGSSCLSRELDDLDDDTPTPVNPVTVEVTCLSKQAVPMVEATEQAMQQPMFRIVDMDAEEEIEDEIDLSFSVSNDSSPEFDNNEPKSPSIERAVSPLNIDTSDQEYKCANAEFENDWIFPENSNTLTFSQPKNDDWVAVSPPLSPVLQPQTSNSYAMNAGSLRRRHG